MKTINEKYKEWLKVCEELDQNPDSGIAANREDFSSFAELEEEISFEKMFELEREGE